ncbi:hypothetical protein HQ602_04945 [Rhodococcus kroppenstedtii]|nr:hypothetical protein [Rhodococcus kroppenstedtii]
MKKSVTWLAAAGVALGLTVTSSPTAQAETLATVMVQTQRTWAPNLASQYKSPPSPPIMVWWQKGVRVSLDCYVRGQAVKGYYSPYIPGGWDNLWYRTPSGDYIADVDINTGSNYPVTRPC